jgi:putative acetyltransferase
MLQLAQVGLHQHRISEVITREAFWNKFQPGADEHFILNKIRNHEDYIPELDLIAEYDGKVVGSIVYSKSKLHLPDDSVWTDVCTFGPVAILPDYQSQGFGGQLVRHSFDIARSLGYRAVIIYGDPRYYGRLGFRTAERFDITNMEGKFVYSMMAYPLIEDAFPIGFSASFTESSVFQEIDPIELEEFDKFFSIKEKAHAKSQDEFQLFITLSYKRKY